MQRKFNAHYNQRLFTLLELTTKNEANTVHVWRSQMLFSYCNHNICGSGLKGIVSRDFEECFLILLDSSDIATPEGTCSFYV
jgi:hypothetical protein